MPVMDMVTTGRCEPYRTQKQRNHRHGIGAQATRERLRSHPRRWVRGSASERRKPPGPLLWRQDRRGSPAMILGNRVRSVIDKEMHAADESASVVSTRSAPAGGLSVNVSRHRRLEARARPGWVASGRKSRDDQKRSSPDGWFRSRSNHGLHHPRIPLRAIAGDLIEHRIDMPVSSRIDESVSDIRHYRQTPRGLHVTARGRARRDGRSTASRMAQMRFERTGLRQSDQSRDRGRAALARRVHDFTGKKTPPRRKILVYFDSRPTSSSLNWPSDFFRDALPRNVNMVRSAV